MSLKQKFVSGLALAFAVGAFSTFAAAQDKTTAPDDSMRNQEKSERRGGYGKGMRGGKHGGGGDRMMMHALEKLNLSDSQKVQVKTAFENHKTQNQPQMEEMRGLGMKKRDGIITADEETRFKELRTQMKASNEQLHNSILAILTAEQRTQLDQMKEEMRQKKMERHQNRQDQTAPAPQVK